ncbi:MAG: glycosyltransferase family 4 protein [Candidatus Tectomicrobia bacterium]|nr:glycosyltransferase family 4 protein [Candidatus Tectomicrobia bacterium]
MRIAFLDSWHEETARGSGTAAGIAGLARGLEALGHEVARLRPRWRLPGLTLRRLLYNAELPLRLDPRAFDLIVGFDLDGFLLPRAPDVVCLKGVAAEEMAFEAGWPRLQLGFLARLEGRNARRARRVLVPSGHSLRAASGAYSLPAGQIAVVPEGIDLAPWDALRAAHGPGRGASPPVILSVARQYARKNTAALLEAMPAVRAEAPGALLRVVGGGPMLRALERRAAELGLGGVAAFLGELPRDEDVRREYLAADVFCLPSLQEGFGIVFLEAMAAGLPIVAARAGAVPEVAAEGEAALLVPPGDTAALAGALARLLRDAGLRARLGEGGRRRVRRYGWPEVARRFLEEAGRAGPGS